MKKKTSQLCKAFKWVGGSSGWFHSFANDASPPELALATRTRTGIYQPCLERTARVRHSRTALQMEIALPAGAKRCLAIELQTHLSR